MSVRTAFEARGKTLAFGLAVTGLLAFALISSSIAGHLARATVAFAAATGAALQILVALARREPVFWVRSPIFLLLLGALATSVILGPKDLQALERAAIWLAMLAAGASLRDYEHRGARRAALGAALAVMTLLVLYGLAQSLWLFEALRESARAIIGRTLRPEEEAFMRSMRARATFGQANGFAGYLLLFLPCAWLIFRSPKLSLWTRGAALLLPIGGLAVSGSKGGAWTAILVSALLLPALDLPRPGVVRVASRSLAALLLVAAGLAILAAAGVFGSDAIGIVETLRHRLEFWDTALRMALDHPLHGVGLERYGDFADQYRGPSDHFARYAHQALLHVLAEAGLMGAVPALLAVIFAFRGRRAAAPTDATTTRRPALPYALGALVLAVMVTPPDRVEVFFFDSESTPLFWIGALLTCAAVLLVVCKYLVPAWSDALATAVDVRPGLVRWILAAFLIHGLIDFDLHVDGITATLALLLGLLPGAVPARRPSSAAWALTIAGVLVFTSAAHLVRVRGLDHVLEAAGDADARTVAEAEAERRPPHKHLVLATAWSLARSDVAAARALLDRHRAVLKDLPAFQALDDAIPGR